MLTALKDFYNASPVIVHQGETLSEVYPERQFKLADQFVSEKASATFSLGVYNVHPYKDSDSLITVDPLSLLALLSVLKREKGKLPRFLPMESSGSVFNAANKRFSSIVVLSANASTDNQLPLLVEDTRDTINKKILRKVYHTALINSLNSSHLNDADKLLHDYLNKSLFDLYNLSIISLDDKTLLNYYSLLRYNFVDKLQSFKPLVTILAAGVRALLLKRNNFHLRNPNIVTYLSATWSSSAAELAFHSECAKIKLNAKEVLKLIGETLDSQDYWLESSQTPSIIDYQIASYIYCMHHFADKVPDFKSVLNANAHLIPYSEKIISAFL